MPVATIATDVTAAIAAHVAAANPHNQYLLASGVSAYGASLIGDADAATARTTLELGTAATLNVGASAGNVVQLDGSARLPAVDGSQLTGIAASPAGSDTQIQYNNAGTLAGASGITRTGSGVLRLATRLEAPVWRPEADGTAALKIKTAADADFVTFDTTNKRVGIGAAPGNNGLLVKGILRIENSGNTNGFTFDPLSGTLIANGNASTRLTGSGYGLGSLRLDAPRVIHIESTRTNDSAAYIYMSTAGIVRYYLGNDGLAGYAVGFLPTALLDLGGSTTARASLRIRSGTAPTSPNDGDVWNNGTNFQVRVGGTTYNLDMTPA